MPARCASPVTTPPASPTPCADAGALDAGARALDDVTRDDDDLTLQLPSDGGVQSLRDVLDRLDEESIEVEELSVHTPDLDDVFLALTGKEALV